MFSMNVNKLNGKIVEKNMTKEGLSALIGIDRATFFRRIKNNNLKLADVHRICEVMNLTTDETISIFFSK